MPGTMLGTIRDRAVSKTGKIPALGEYVVD